MSRKKGLFLLLKLLFFFFLFKRNFFTEVKQNKFTFLFLFFLIRKFTKVETVYTLLFNLSVKPITREAKKRVILCKICICDLLRHRAIPYSSPNGRKCLLSTWSDKHCTLVFASLLWIDTRFPRETTNLKELRTKNKNREEGHQWIFFQLMITENTLHFRLLLLFRLSFLRPRIIWWNLA